jgi:hypothetical protein
LPGCSRRGDEGCQEDVRIDDNPHNSAIIYGGTDCRNG